MTTTPVTDADRETFERLLDLEAEVRLLTVIGAFVPGGTAEVSAAAKAANLDAVRGSLFDALNDLTPEQALAYGKYRQAQA